MLMLRFSDAGRHGRSPCTAVGVRKPSLEETAGTGRRCALSYRRAGGAARSSMEIWSQRGRYMGRERRFCGSGNDAAGSKRVVFVILRLVVVKDRGRMGIVNIAFERSEPWPAKKPA